MVIGENFLERLMEIANVIEEVGNENMEVKMSVTETEYDAIFIHLQNRYPKMVNKPKKELTIIISKVLFIFKKG